MRKHLLAVAVAGVCAAGAVAQGQVRQIIGGNAMDANPQVGGGGSNAPINGYIPVNNNYQQVNGNDIINGNVGGLKYFHGRIPYSAPFEFRGNLGSAALNNFNRQSYSGAPLGQPNMGQTSAYYNPIRQTSGQQGNYYASQTPTSPSNQYLPGTSISPVNGNTTIYGSPLTINTPINAQAGARRYDDVAQLNPMEVTPLQPSGLFGFKSALQAPSYERPIDRIEKERLEKEKEASRTDIGSQVRINKDVEPIAKAIEPINANPIGRAEDESEVYGALQQKLAAKRPGVGTGAEKGTMKVAGGGSTTKPDAFATARAIFGDRTGAAPGGAAGEFAVPYQSEDPSKPFFRPATQDKEKKALTEQSAETLQSGKEVAPIVTFKGGRNTVFEEYMKMAEQQLKEGRYLDAAGTYQSAGQMSPDNPLALVGRAHAQLAAGMYLAAVEDLQVVFERKPEMIAVRYDLSAFIPKQRLDNLLKDVATLTRADRFNPTASFALAYMDYQTGRTDDLKLTLEMWKRLRPKDPWPKVLEKAWLDEVKKEK